MSDTIVLVPEVIVPSPTEALRFNEAVAVRSGRIASIGKQDDIMASWPDAKVETLPSCLIMAGLVNAHQHGRGVSQIQLGYQDDFLELWIAQRRGRGILDPYPITKLAAANMLAHGVTATVHANYTYGSGDYESELRASLRAYDESGIRVTMCVGAMDRGMNVYPPDEACFLNGLPIELKHWLTRGGRTLYAGDADSTIALMDRLLRDYEGHPRIRFCYGPAGPQWVSDQLWESLARDADRRGVGLHFHALESPAQAAVTKELYPNGVFSHLRKLGVMTSRSTIAHGVWVSDRDIEAIAQSDATVVRNPGCNLRLRNGIAPLERYLAQGARVAVGTDNLGLTDNEDLLNELRLAALLGRSPEWHGHLPPASADLLAMSTINGAVAAQIAPEVGTLEVGNKADLIAVDLQRVRQPYLDEDMPILDAFFARASGADVRLTMVDGRIVFRNGDFVDLDREVIEGQAAEAALAARVPRDPEDRLRAAALREHLVSHYRARKQHC